MTTSSETIVRIDTRGLRCPMPVLRLEAALRSVKNGTRIRILADDPIATIDIPHHAKSAGHLVERQADEATACVFLVTARKKTGST